MKNSRLWLFFILACFASISAADGPDPVLTTTPERSELSESGSPRSRDGPHQGHQESHHNGHQASENTPIWSIDENVRVAFELTDSNGETVTQEDYLGHYVLLSFGFTHCEYVCPTIAAKMAQALKLSSEEALGIFISVDTERDTPLLTDNYARQFGEGMLGLSGTYTQISDAANNLGVTFAVTKSQHSYTVQHSATIYLIGPKGELVDIYALNVSPRDIAAAIN